MKKRKGEMKGDWVLPIQGKHLHKGIEYKGEKKEGTLGEEVFRLRKKEVEKGEGSSKKGREQFILVQG